MAPGGGGGGDERRPLMRDRSMAMRLRSRVVVAVASSSVATGRMTVGRIGDEDLRLSAAGMRGAR